MGQYYIIANIDKQQYLHPHHCGDGLKLKEFGCSGMGTMMALTTLLVSGNGRGSGDLHSTNPIVGSWAGDCIVISGDYDDEGLYDAPPDQNIYHVARETWVDVSYHAMHAACEDEHIQEALMSDIARGDNGLLTKAWPLICNPPSLGVPSA